MEENESQETPKEEVNTTPKKKKEKNTYSTLNLLKTNTRVFFIVMGRITLYVLIGLLLNFVLYIFIDNRVSLMIDSQRLSFVWNLTGYALIALFLVGFPIIYFLFGQKNGVQRAIYVLLHQAKDFLFVFLIDRFFKWVNKRPDLKEKVEENRIDSLLNDSLPYYLKHFHQMSFVMRWIYKQFSKKFDFKELILQEVEEIGGTLDEPALKEHVADEATKKVPMIIIKKPAHRPLLILMGANVIVFFLVKLLVTIPT
ncbi:MAG: hypothetical protein ACFB0B_19800 [Thermonemataceae bacterium]